MTAQWYYAIRGRTLGPVTAEDLRQRASRGEIVASDLVWREGMPDWAPADSLGLTTAAAPPPVPGDLDTPTPIPQPAADPSVPHPVASPPRIGPPRVEPANRSTGVEPAATRTTPGREKRERPSKQVRRTSGASPVFRAACLAIGIFAILVCVFWIGHVIGTKSGRDGESPVALGAAAKSPTRPNLRDGQAAINLDDAPSPRAKSPGFAAPPTPRSTSREVVADPDPFIQPADEPPAPPSPPVVSATPSPSSEPAKPSVAERESSPATPTPAGAPPRKDEGPRIVFQTLEIHRKPTFVVQGMTLPQELRYRIISQLEIAARGVDGARKVVQIVERTHLDHADDLSRATFAKSLKELERQQYTFKLNEHNEVVEFTGPKKNLVSLPVALPTGKGFQLTSVIDEDGWKELAQLTFFQPDDSVAQGQPYVRQMSHDWTPLGSWSGTTTFIGNDARGDLQSIRFQHALTYTPPAAKAATGPLGFRVVSATCTIDQADGTIEFDREDQRVTTASETFRVHGNVATELLGQPVNIQLQEQQLMTIRVTDQRPS